MVQGECRQGWLSVWAKHPGNVEDREIKSLVMGQGERKLNPDGDEGARWFGLFLSSGVFLVLNLLGTFISWESSCSMAFGGQMDAAPGSTLGRFCLGTSRYQDNHHFWLWPVPLIGFIVIGCIWAVEGEWPWYGWIWAAGAGLAFLYYSPFLLLPGR